MPTRRRRLGPLLDEGEQPAVDSTVLARYQKRVSTRILALQKHYGIESDSTEDMRALVLWLANDWVPGFWTNDEPTLPRRPGRPKDPMQTVYDLELYFGIEKLRAEKRRTLGDLCKLYKKREMGSRHWQKFTQESLANEYRRIKRVLGPKLIQQFKNSVATDKDIDATIEMYRKEYEKQHRLKKALMTAANFPQS